MSSLLGKQGCSPWLLMSASVTDLIYFMPVICIADWIRAQSGILGLVQTFSGASVENS